SSPFQTAALAHRNRSTHWRVIDRASKSQTQVSSVSIHLAQLLPFPNKVLAKSCKKSLFIFTKNNVQNVSKINITLTFVISTYRERTETDTFLVEIILN